MEDDHDCKDHLELKGLGSRKDGEVEVPAYCTVCSRTYWIRYDEDEYQDLFWNKEKILSYFD